MEKNKALSAGVKFLILTALFWAVRLVFIYLYTETTFPCEWRVGNIAREILTNPLLPPIKFLNYTCIGIMDAWQIIEGILLVPFYFVFGSSLFTLKLFSVCLAYLNFCGWYILVRKYISDTAATIFALLYIFSLPFYLEGSLFLVGTHVQINLFIPYILLLLFGIWEKVKTDIRPFIFMGLLTALGTYFSFEYYLVLFLFLFFVLVRKHTSRKGILSFVFSFIFFTLPYCYSFILTKETYSDYRGAWRSGLSGFKTLVARFDWLSLRYYELFTYKVPKLLGITLLTVFLLSLIYLLLFKRKNNKLISAGLIFFVILNLGRILSRFNISYPVCGLFWGGSSRYFIFGFELILLFVACFFAFIQSKPLGKVISYILLAGFILSSLFFVFSDFNIDAVKRSFPLGYNYEDVGNRIFFWNDMDYKKSLSLIEARKSNQKDKGQLIRGLIEADVGYYFLDKTKDINIETVKEFSLIIDTKYKNIFYSSLGKTVVLKYREKPRELIVKLFELEKYLGKEDYLYILRGASEGPVFANINNKELLELAGFIGSQGSFYKDYLWIILGRMKAVKNIYAEDCLRAEIRSTCGALEELPAEEREYILTGYFKKVISLSCYGDYGSLYHLMRSINGQRFAFKDLFLNMLKENMGQYTVKY